MRVTRILGSRLARFLFVLIILMLPWPGLGRAYVRAVAGLADSVLGSEGSSVTLQFNVPTDSAGAVSTWQLDVRADDATTGKFVQTALDLRRGGYIASAVFLALTLATRLRWLKKLGLAVTGLTLLQGLPLLPLLFFFSGKLPVQVFNLGSVTTATIEIAYHTFVAPPGMAYAVPALLWFLLTWLLDPTCLPTFLRPLSRRD